MKAIFAVAMMLCASTALAADRALILNDQEQAALRHILDVATKAQGIEIAPNTIYFINKLNAAGVVTERKDDPKPAEEPKP